MPEYEPEEQLEEVGEELGMEELTAPPPPPEESPEADEGIDTKNIIRRMRIILNDVLNRIQRDREAHATEKGATELELDPLTSPSRALYLLENRVTKRDGIIQASETSFQSLRQELDTLERLLRQRRNT